MKRRRRWLPRRVATRVEYSGPLSTYVSTGDRKVVLHTEGVKRRRPEAVWLARYVNGEEIPYHATWDTRTGRWAQMVPFDHPARALENGGIAAGVGCNRLGSVVIQVCIAGFSGGEWSRWPRRIRGAWVLADLMDSWGIPWEALCNWQHPTRSLSRWRGDGVTCHAAAPGNSHVDGAGINWRRLKRVALKQQRRRRRK